MRRLLQGDVGSGKTVVALYCLLRAVEAGMQGALMAPTETLAGQHAETAARLVGAAAPVELLTAALTARERRAALERIAERRGSIVIGTHALLQEDVAFADLALLVVDEQHRFGVEQRDELVRRAERGGRAPHVLHMTATPIPRTLALTVYGDLDVTTIEGSPEGRQPVVTRLVDEARRDEGYEFVRKQLAEGARSTSSARRSTSPSRSRRPRRWPRPSAWRPARSRDWRVGVVHGQLKSAERDEVMHAFTARGGAGARRHQPHRGGHRRAQRHRDDRRGRRALRARPAAPAARARGEGDGQVVLSAVLAGRDRAARRPAWRRCSRPTTASSWPTATSRSAARDR